MFPLHLLVALVLLVGSSNAVHADDTIDYIDLGTTTSSSTTTTTTSTTTSTSGATTSSTTTSTSTTTTSTTAVPDGAALVHNAIGTNSGATGYLGAAGPSTIPTTQTNTHAWWVTNRAYETVSGIIRVGNPPGASKSWDVTLVYAETALAATETCGDVVGSTVSVSLGSISGASNRSHDFGPIDLTAVHGNVGIAAGSCFQVVFTATGAPASQGSDGVSLELKEASGDGITVFAASSASGVSATAYLGSALTSTATSVQSYITFPEAVTACSGAVAITTPPGTGDTWTVNARISTAGKTDSQSCDDLSYTTVSALCDITGASEKSCVWALNGSIDVPANGCMQLELAETGTAANTGAATWSVECSSEGSEPAVGGGGLVASSTLGNNNNATTNFAIVESTGNAERASWTTGGTAYTECAGSYNHATPGTATDGGYDVSITVADITSTQSCSLGSPSFADAGPGTVCNIDVDVGEKGCSFSGAAVTIPARSCVRLTLTRTGTVTAAPADGQWSLSCKP